MAFKYPLGYYVEKRLEGASVEEEDEWIFVYRVSAGRPKALHLQ